MNGVLGRLGSLIRDWCSPYVVTIATVFLAVSCEIFSLPTGWAHYVGTLYWTLFFLPIVLAEAYLDTKRGNRKWLFLCLFSYIGLIALISKSGGAERDASGPRVSRRGSLTYPFPLIGQAGYFPTYFAAEGIGNGSCGNFYEILANLDDGGYEC